MTTFFLYRLLITAISFQNIVKEASQKSGEIQFEFNQQKGNVYYCNEFGEFDFVSNGHFSSQAQDEYFMFNYSSEIALQTLIISKHHSIKIIQKDTFLVPQTGDLKKYAELNFNESYLKYNKSYKEPMFYKTAFFDEEYSNKPQKREENFDKELKKQRLFLNRYTKKNQLDSNFLELWDKYFFYNMLQKKFFLGFGQAKFNKFPNAYIKEICKEGINSQNDRFLFLHQYKVAMSLLVENLTLLSSDNNVNKNDRKYNIIVNNFRGRTKDYLLFNFIYDIYKQNNIEDFLLFKQKFEIDCKSPIYKSFINSFAKRNENKRNALIKTDKNFIDFLKVIKEKKYTYIDFWASWCGPCRSEIPASMKLHEEYSSKEINFVYISIDNNSLAWERAYVQIGLPKIKNYLLPNWSQSEIGKLFNLSSIPRYVLIGKDGKVINADAPRPSDPKIRKLFDELLKK